MVRRGREESVGIVGRVVRFDFAGQHIRLQQQTVELAGRRFVFRHPGGGRVGINGCDLLTSRHAFRFLFQMTKQHTVHYLFVGTGGGGGSKEELLPRRRFFF